MNRLRPGEAGQIERHPVGEHAVEHHAERVDIGAAVDIGRAASQLFRAHVRERAHQLSVRGLHGDAIDVGAGGARDAEIEHLRLPAAATRTLAGFRSR